MMSTNSGELVYLYLHGIELFFVPFSLVVCEQERAGSRFSIVLCCAINVEWRLAGKAIRSRQGAALGFDGKLVG